MEYTRMPVIAWSDLYNELVIEYGQDFADSDLDDAIAKETCNEDSDLVYFYIYRDDTTYSGSEIANLNKIRQYLRNIFPGDTNVIIDFVL